jgi:hypothetical protein
MLVPYVADLAQAYPHKSGMAVWLVSREDLTTTKQT